MSTVIIGCDPGGTTGLCLLGAGAPLAFQCSSGAALMLASLLIEASLGAHGVVLAGEAWAPGPGRGTDAAVTKKVIGDLSALGQWHWRTAGSVKPWATDEKLKVAGLLEPCRDMRHAADAMRHAMFAAVHDCGWPTPLSREGRAFWKEMR